MKEKEPKEGKSLGQNIKRDRVELKQFNSKSISAFGINKHFCVPATALPIPPSVEMPQITCKTCEVICCDLRPHQALCEHHPLPEKIELGAWRNKRCSQMQLKNWLEPCPICGSRFVQIIDNGLTWQHCSACGHDSRCPRCGDNRGTDLDCSTCGYRGEDYHPQAVKTDRGEDNKEFEKDEEKVVFANPALSAYLEDDEEFEKEEEIWKVEMEHPTDAELEVEDLLQYLRDIGLLRDSKEDEEKDEGSK